MMRIKLSQVRAEAHALSLVTMGLLSLLTKIQASKHTSERMKKVKKLVNI